MRKKLYISIFVALCIGVIGAGIIWHLSKMKIVQEAVEGCIWKDENDDIWYTSFTPDTLLNYPSNTFFQLLIYKLAANLTALNGTQNQYLIEVQIPEAEVAFAEHLAKDNISVVRMQNDL